MFADLPKTGCEKSKAARARGLGLGPPVADGGSSDD